MAVAQIKSEAETLAAVVVAAATTDPEKPPFKKCSRICLVCTFASTSVPKGVCRSGDAYPEEVAEAYCAADPATQLLSICNSYRPEVIQAPISA